jgi:hypothetical protein
VEDYGEKSNYIKACQMDVFTDEDDYEKYFKYDRSFEKNLRSSDPFHSS